MGQEGLRKREVTRKRSHQSRLHQNRLLKILHMQGPPQATQSEAKSCLFNQALRMNLVCSQYKVASQNVCLGPSLARSQRRLKAANTGGSGGQREVPLNWSREAIEASSVRRDQDCGVQYYGQISNSKEESLKVGNCGNKHMFSLESTD